MSQQETVVQAAPEMFGSAAPSPAPPQPREPNGKPSSGRWVLVGGILVAITLAAALVAATLPRLQHEKQLNTAVAQVASSPPRVSVVTARRAPATSQHVLPGNAQAFREAALFARTTGYLKRWLVDIGDRVREGQLIADISAPDVDDQLAQARANLGLAKANLVVSEANLALARITLSRDRRAGVGTAAETIDQDQAQVQTSAAQVESAKASIQANQATVQQFTDLQSYQKIIAPFPGVITARNVDPGALIVADNPTGTRELFHIMQTDPLRVFVNVPQVYATKIVPGQDAAVYQEQEPLQQFAGKVTRTANALDPNTRTLLTEVDVPNPKNALQPGMYLQVKFTAVRGVSAVMIPSAALVIRNDGAFVPVLDQQKRVHYRKVERGRDYGAEVEVLTGLDGGETVVVYPGDALPEGQEVEPVPAPK
ncbi:MAG TPA: efflux RND transporter periplasmic adaptor subunit [Gemmataceae bacterium]|nr:efflux RND transporter periplasmic adaptor subunit [Gemmataceae bacterium]